MSSIVISGDSSGAVTLQAPAAAGATTLTLPTTSGTLCALESTLGVSQTWQDVTASRALSTTYTNTTGRPIQISINVNSISASGGAVNLTINGVIVATQGAVQNASIATRPNITHIIPNGSTYSISNLVSGPASIGLASWFELR